MNNAEVIETMRTAIDDGLRSFINQAMIDSPVGFKDMMSYQLGWIGKNCGKAAYGKRTRPTLLLLVCHALGGDWRKAIPAAVSVELLHNYTLIHDDIQDRSLTRRGRDCVWVKWGEAQAINAGDAMYALACSSSLDLKMNYPIDVVLSVISQLHHTSFLLTSGQYLDIAYENAEEIDFDDYWKMIQGKTGELLSTCITLGALLSGKKETELEFYKDFGLKIGSAFQVQDDLLGIWGTQEEIGKSVHNDLRDRKKTYPILMALGQLPDFREYWHTHDSLNEDDVNALLTILNRSDVKDATFKQSQRLYNEVICSLSELFHDETRVVPLRRTIEDLLYRSR